MLGMSAYAVGGDLAGDVHLAGGDQRLDRDAAGRVVGEQRVEDRVADRVGDLVGVALGDRLGGEQATGHGAPRGRARACARRLSRASLPTTRGRSAGQARRDEVPHGVGEGVLAAQRARRSSTRPRRARWRRCASPSKPVGWPGSPTSLTTSRSQPLRASLARPWSSTRRRRRRSRRRTRPPPGPPARAADQLGEHVGVLHQLDGQRARSSCAWWRRPLDGPVVGDRRGHDHRVGGRAAAAQHGVAQLERRWSTRTTLAPGGVGQRRRP